MVRVLRTNKSQPRYLLPPPQGLIPPCRINGVRRIYAVCKGPMYKNRTGCRNHESTCNMLKLRAVNEAEEESKKKNSGGKPGRSTRGNVDKLTSEGGRSLWNTYIHLSAGGSWKVKLQRKPSHENEAVRFCLLFCWLKYKTDCSVPRRIK